MKAIIPAAGHGTRFLPVTKVVPKEMLPLGNKPALQWLVEEALLAGADEVVIVTSPEKPAIKAYFTPDPHFLERVATRPSIKQSLLELDKLSERVRFVEQREQAGLGHAILQAEGFFNDPAELVLVLLGDALVGGSRCCSQELTEVSAAYNNAAILGLERVPASKVSQYGIISGNSVTNHENLFKVQGVVEKPAQEVAPSNLAIAGRYLLPARIFAILATLERGHNNEIQLTDAIVNLIEKEPVYGYCYSGRRYDIGNPSDYAAAISASVFNS